MYMQSNEIFVKSASSFFAGFSNTNIPEVFIEGTSVNEQRHAMSDVDENGDFVTWSDEDFYDDLNNYGSDLDEDFYYSYYDEI